MADIEKELRIFQLDLAGQAIECSKAGFDLSKTYEALRQEFVLDGQLEEETRQLEVNGEIKAFLFSSCHEDNEGNQVERLLVVGVTPKGYFASPSLLFERIGNDYLRAFTVRWKKSKLIWNVVEEPWRPVINRRGDWDLLRDSHCFDNYILLVEGKKDDEIQSKPAGFPKRMELLERWGIRFPLRTEHLYI